MHRLPFDFNCDECGSPATVEFITSDAEKTRLSCNNHKPTERFQPGSKLLVRRSRLSPNYRLSKYFAQSPDSAQHRQFREEMCITPILGSDGACKYYLSALTQIDHFALWSDQFVENVREYLLTETSDAANYFLFDSCTIESMTSFLKVSYSQRFPTAGIAIKPHDRAIEILLRNPNWSDAQIAAAAKTTVKQLLRCSDYKILRMPRTRSLPAGMSGDE